VHLTHSARSSLSLATGIFTRTRVNWNQVSTYAIDSAITSGLAIFGFGYADSD
jgi:hypothetical protein